MPPYSRWPVRLLDKISTSIQKIFVKHKDIEILDLSINITILSLRFVPEGHEDKAILLSNLAGRFALKFECHNDRSDLNKAIDLIDQANAIESPDLRSRVSIADNSAILKTYAQHEAIPLSPGPQISFMNIHEASSGQNNQYSAILSPNSAFSHDNVPAPSSLSANLSGSTGRVIANNAGSINTGINIVSYS